MIVRICQQICSLQVGADMLIYEECVTVQFDLFVDIRNCLCELVDRVLEFVVGHSDRLLFELLHNCLIDEGQ